MTEADFPLTHILHNVNMTLCHRHTCKQFRLCAIARVPLELHVRDV